MRDTSRAEKEREQQTKMKGESRRRVTVVPVDRDDSNTQQVSHSTVPHLKHTISASESPTLLFCSKMLKVCLHPFSFHLSKSCSVVTCHIWCSFLWLTCFSAWDCLGGSFSWSKGSQSVPWWDKSSFGQMSGEDVETNTRLQAQCDGGTMFFFWTSIGTSCRWQHLSFVLSQHQTGSPHRGHEKKSRGITRVLPMALPSVSPPPSPPLLPPPSSLFFSYIPGALFFAGKHSPATGGEVELFSGINGNSAWSKLPECSY